MLSMFSALVREHENVGLGMCEQGLLSSNWELLNFLLPRTQFEQEVLWLISNFVRFAWTKIFGEDSAVGFDKFFGFLRFKYRTDKRILGDILGTIIGLG